MNAARTLIALLLVTGVASAQDGSNEAIFDKLNAMRISVNFEDTPLREVVNFMSDFTGLTFLIHPDVYDDEELITLQLKGVRPVSVLRLIMRPLDLAAVVKEGMVVIMPKENLHMQNKVQIYDVRDLFLRISNFPGPRLELLPGAGAGGGPGVSFTLEEPNEPRIDEYTLEEIIQMATGWEAWDENEYASLQFTPNRMLIVTQTSEVQAEIRKIINMLRWFK